VVLERQAVRLALSLVEDQELRGRIARLLLVGTEEEEEEALELFA
jgi:hypothetical protein